ncbi:CoA pyrophosphatase [Flavobacterium columnare]|uniref:Pyrophosphohydrolase n=2 Tax=Flavobacterium columnare TaxID=996 RepID=G8X878_FLACA|nr:CoA pyrophosphatase [Flavobacterium columnare]AEW85015.1 pyrophosphohydrolase [Flavobacterium columnare ATCC 49512]AMO19360.1 CoA pyrophosphatase [Flavobacterium columnare]ANO49211.1 pyrophosphohydrolase [Flavobacterium columnare]APT22797.1 coenzyme A pyrophosphatase [Flavobacterium columnare]AUX17299.1 NUDIX hydrolase [Flavobacterium columnare]
MEFSNFLKYIPKIAKETLPAKESHSKMIPIERIKFLEELNIETIIAKKAAVMMLFYPKNHFTHLALIVRNSYPGVHSSQIAFPGGKIETCDKNLSETALRETDEEIGIPKNKIQLIRPFTEVYIPPSNYLVYPFLGICQEELFFNLNPEEVADIVELPLHHFLDDRNITYVNMDTSYAAKIKVPAFEIDGHIIWGATAMMMSELKDTIKKVL